MIASERAKDEKLAAAPGVAGAGAGECEKGVEAIEGFGAVVESLGEIGVEDSEGEREHGAAQGRVGFGVGLVL